MNEQGQLVRVNFKEARSMKSWTALRAGQSREWQEEELTDELRLALSKLKGEELTSLQSQPIRTSIMAHTDLAAVLKVLLTLSGIHCDTIEEPQLLDPATDYLLVAAGIFRCNMFKQAEEAFLTTGIPWIPLYLEGKLVRFGPLMGPYLQLKDLTTRLLSASPSPDVLQDFWAYAETIRDPGLPFSRSEQQWLVATISLLLEEWHSGRSRKRGFPPERYQLTLIPTTREIIYHPVLRLPSSASAERMKSL
ncbi:MULTISPECIES: hypothetical protein [Paenibacillus]|nr:MULTISPECIES: hypothetical protein [Paenibacillus]MUG65504.1 hypothetical protein [Paenibacillus campinasensis]